jgi:hypothetical protein
LGIECSNTTPNRSGCMRVFSALPCVWGFLNALDRGRHMKPILKHLCAASVMLVATAGAAQALTLGAPIFTTAPGTISILNQFEFNLPSPAYTLTMNSLIASAVGAPGLVGKSIHFQTTIFDGFGSYDSSMSIEISLLQPVRTTPLRTKIPTRSLVFSHHLGLSLMMFLQESAVSRCNLFFQLHSPLLPCMNIAKYPTLRFVPPVR